MNVSFAIPTIFSEQQPFMNHQLLEKRFAELSHLLADEDLSRLSRRILDFLADIRVPGEIKQSAIRLRANYNAYAILEKANQTSEKRRELLSMASEVVHTIKSFLDDQPVERKTFAPVTLEDISTDKEKTNFVFQGKQVSKTYISSKYTFKLPAIDLDLKLGEITGIVGENGNGKTTLLRIVAGDLESTSGQIRYPRFNVAHDDWYRIKQNIAFIPQSLPVWQGFLKENLHFTAAIHGIKGAENEDRVDFIIHRLGLTKYEDALWSEISSGYKLRFELARALVWNPGLLIIDEPLANLDINTQQVFLQDLRYLADSTQNPMSILLSSQHLHEVESIADNIIFIKNGEALYNGKMADFGQDRSENLYELSTSLSKMEVQAKLAHLDSVIVEDIGRHMVIHTELNVDSNTLLGEIIGAGIPVEYFRNISTSTLKLFREGRGEN